MIINAPLILAKFAPLHKSYAVEEMHKTIAVPVPY